MLAQSARPASALAVQSLSSGSPEPLCRFGVNSTGGIEEYDTAALQIGWFIDYHATVTPPAIGAEYVPVIRLNQTGPNDFTYSPSGSQLQAAIAANPGAAWLIGNEPDRRIYQDDVEPHIYASAYHELYDLIKIADPDARIFAGTIVQPTPVRLQYLDMVLDSYQAAYGEPMPVDGWSIHNFILNEADDTRCSQVPVEVGCWGAGIPPGIDLLVGEVVGIDQNDSLTLFRERIVRFRQWMADRGYLGLPVYLSEYGVLMPVDFGFDAARVNSFMNGTFDYMLNTTDPLLGDPSDGYRLIQKWSWYSTSDSSYNGPLFDSVSKQPTLMGQNFASYAAQVAPTAGIDLYPAQISADPPVPLSHGENVTVTLRAIVANQGHWQRSSGESEVRFYNGDPSNGGALIGTAQAASLSGCGREDVLEIVWTDVSPGAHQVYVWVDANDVVSESNEQNSVSMRTILVAAHQVFLPISLR